ncbi:hypothetical protein [Streptomyces prunicolor]|uniref:LPXTG cell wall anchor domain-containing protein n=1 Tax=Streptomyces prunicolor TaxID=67348 RepID=A0ABU4FIN2_9ACTN|nr:hypothetical protein [Streptomyces prunicolor]MDV7220447.1 hypothetical protein [Streptomyces prunicolor]
MASQRMVFGAALAAVVLALASGPAAVAAEPSRLPTKVSAKVSTKVPTKAHTTIQADKQIDVGSAAQSVHVIWNFSDPSVNLPPPAEQTLVIDARGLAGVARIAVADPRCTAHGQVFSCANQNTDQLTNLDFTVRADPGAARGATGTMKYTASAGHGAPGTARVKVVVGVPDLVVGKVPDVTHARIGSRIDVPLRLRNTGDRATDRRIAVHWVGAGGLVFDRKFSNCGYSTGTDLAAPASPTSVTCVFPAAVAAGATVELSSPLTAAIGAHVLTGEINYTAELLQPGARPEDRLDAELEPGTGPALTLVPASGTEVGFESGATGRVGVLADSSADLAATATAKPAAGADGWTLNLTVVNHGPAAVYATGNETDNEYVAEVDVVLPRHTVATDYEHAESEDSAYGPCFLWVSDTTTAPFEAGHRHYVCVVPFGIGAGKNVESLLSVKADKSYDGAKGSATVRPGPAGIALHDPNSANDHATFAFSTSTAPPGDTVADTGADRTALIAAGATGAVLLGAAALVVHRRRRRSH